MGENVPQIWDAIMAYKTGYKYYAYPDESIKAKFFCYIEPNRQRYTGFPKAITKMAPEFAKYAMVAAREALQMAFGPDMNLAGQVSPFDIGVVIGTGWGGADAVSYNCYEYLESGTTSSFATVTTMNSVATAAVSLNWNIRGYQNTPVAACATGTMAIGDAYEVIRSGRQKVMLAGGSESLKSAQNVWSIDITQALSKEQELAERACCPFDAKRSGFILSEGAAILCLEEMEYALARGARILGEVTGYANYSDAYDMTAPAEDMLARYHAIGHALRDANCTPDEIDYVNLHGTSTPKNDVNESDAVKWALGDAAYRIPMSSTKSYTGHLIGAAGALESIFCLKTIETGVIPATIHLRHKDPACDLDYTPNEHRPGQTIDTALNLSFGFGGANCAAVFERFVA
jgi:3-oxoacyl-[acyl-carrier-protein] synthase II